MTYQNEQELIDKYIDLVKVCVSKYATRDSYDDLLQEAFIALILASRAYKDTHTCSLTTWIYICINNRLKHFYPLNKYSNKKIEYRTPSNIEEILPETLTKLEKEIIYLRLYNYTFGEISSFYNINLNTIKSKYRKIINKIRKSNASL